MALHLYKWYDSDNEQDFIALGGENSQMAKCYKVYDNYRILHPPTLGQMHKFMAIDPDTFKGPIEITHQEVLELYGPILSETHSTEETIQVQLVADNEYNKNPIYNTYIHSRADSGNHIVAISLRHKAKQKDWVQVSKVSRNELNSYDGILKTFIKSIKKKNGVKMDLWEVKPYSRKDLRKSKEYK